jgi:membrane-bound metal-dependent hydrolase YbcI (DUF457 family)
VLLGHFAVGFASKRWAPKTSLALLVAAPLFLDLMWPIALATGIESVKIDPSYSAVVPLDLHDYGYTHSLAGALVLTLLFSLGTWAFTRDRRVSLVVALGVFSHFILDFVTHPPDMPLYPGSKVGIGLGLWRSIPGTMAVEIALWIAGLAIYGTTTRARDRVGQVSLFAMVLLLSAIYVWSIFGPPPAEPRAIIVGAFFAWLFVPWSGWIDRHRKPAR